MPRLIAYGRNVGPTLGILGDADISARLLEGTGLNEVIVLQVQSGSAAARAGLRAADVSPDGKLVGGAVIVAVYGMAVDSVEALIEILDQHRVGDAVALGIRRGSQVIDVQAVLGSGSE